MNEHDSERIAGLFALDGMSATSDLDAADVLFINTCTIREAADNRMYGNLGQLKEWKDRRPNSLLVVGGCAAQKDRELVREKAPWVDVVMGTNNLDRVLDLIDYAEAWGGITEVVDSLEAMPSSLAGAARARPCCLDFDPGWLQQLLHVLHRPRGARPGGEPAARATSWPRCALASCPGSGRADPPRTERRHLRPRSCSRWSAPFACLPICCARLDPLTESPGSVSPARIRPTSNAMSWKQWRRLQRSASSCTLPLQSGSDRILSGDATAATPPQRYLDKLALARELIPDLIGVHGHHRGLSR